MSRRDSRACSVLVAILRPSARCQARPAAGPAPRGPNLGPGGLEGQASSGAAVPGTHWESLGPFQFRFPRHWTSTMAGTIADADRQIMPIYPHSHAANSNRTIARPGRHGRLARPRVPGSAEAQPAEGQKITKGGWINNKKSL